MPVSFRNYEFAYNNEKGKPVFAPSPEGRAIGEKLKSIVEASADFHPLYYHYQDGGHVAAMHRHRKSRFFAKADLRDFFYSVSRNRIQKSLRAIGVKRHEYFAKWSTVKDPYKNKGYVLPYGFVQSPILATLVLSTSDLGFRLNAISNRMTVTVYLDDIFLSADDLSLLADGFKEVLDCVGPSGFVLNEAKTVEPCSSIRVFNCDIETGRSVVSLDRREAFAEEIHSAHGVEAFERYCASVEAGNIAT